MDAPILLFPGQGTEGVGMSTGWTDRPAWKATLDAGEAHSGFALRAWMAEGPLEVLRAQRHGPAAVLSHSVGAYRTHRAAGLPLPKAGTGHSMGFFSCLVAAEVMTLEEGLNLLRATEDESERRFPSGSMGMGFLIGIPEAEVRRLLEGREDLLLSNVNGTAQVTVSGPKTAISAFVAEHAPRCLKAGLLPVDLPLHSDHMAPLLPFVKDRMGQVTPKDPAFPLLSPLDGRVIADGFEAFEEAVVSIAATIHWPHVTEGLKSMEGPLLECGHGQQLANLTRWILRDRPVGSLQALPVN
jgi:[acyl-carrier-protein] S-malonyltransferase